MCERSGKWKDGQSRIPGRNILWIVRNEHKDRLWENFGRLTELCRTCAVECFEFSGEGVSICMLVAGGASSPEQTSGENLQTTTRVKIMFGDFPEDIQALPLTELYPGMDIIIVDRGDFCEMTTNRSGESKKFRWKKHSFKIKSFRSTVEPDTNRNE